MNVAFMFFIVYLVVIIALGLYATRKSKQGINIEQSIDNAIKFWEDNVKGLKEPRL